MKKNTILSLVCFLMAFVVFALAVPITSFAKESASMYASVGDFVGQKVYTIRNVELDNYMQADDNGENHVELWSSNNYAISQRWIVTELQNGYCKIENLLTGQALSVESGKENSGSDRLLLETYSGSYRQQWKITETIKHNLKVKPRSSEGYTKDWVMAAGNGILTTQGRNVLQKNYKNDNDLKDEWDFTYVADYIPVSGSEITYNPGLWNANSTVKLGTNCYSYSLNNQVHPNTNILWYMQPGESVNISLSQTDITATRIKELVQMDAEQLGFIFESVDKNAVCDEGSYKVALVVAPGQDYHWYRQNPDGTWSHKPGQQDVVYTDASNNIIIDPQIADRSYSYANYTEFVGFFRVTPLNNMYGATRTLSSSTILLLDTIVFDENKTNLPDACSVELISDGMTYSEVTDILGAPQEMLTFGLTVVGYKLSDGSTLSVNYSKSVEGHFVVNGYSVIHR